MRENLRFILIVGIITLVLSLFYFVTVYSMSYKRNPPEKEKELTVYYVDEQIPLDVNSEFWKNITPVRIHLQPQSARVPYGSDEREIFVRGVYNGSEIGFLVEFEDESENLGLPANPDACAILFVPGESPATSQMMGYNSKANIWHWLADRNLKRYREGDTTVNVVRELIATGPGTQTPMPKQLVEGKGEYTNGKWKVVFKRRLKRMQEDELDFGPGKNFKIAFAVWDGEKMESFSRKSISILRKLVLKR
jgi:DMSO reductase family type II enzyme heme b subunit